MKERGIIFSTPMIRAILAGTKSETRRVIKPQPPENLTPGHFAWSENPVTFGVVFCRHSQSLEVCDARFLAKSKHGGSGDRLWVRETHCVGDPWLTGGHVNEPPEIIRYKADDKAVRWLGTKEEYEIDCAKENWSWPAAWRSPYAMLRSSARITLDVASVRAERLHDLTNEAARREGIPEYFRQACELGLTVAVANTNEEAEIEEATWTNRTSVENFARLWDALNGHRGTTRNASFPWESNPWVWVISWDKVTVSGRKE